MVKHEELTVVRIGISLEGLKSGVYMPLVNGADSLANKCN